MDKIIYGADTETVRGLPMTLQFYSEDIRCNDLYYVDETNAFRTFMRWVDERRTRCQHIVYVHHLAFDLIEFLYGAHEQLASPSGDFAFEVGDWRASGVYGTPTFLKLNRSDHTSVWLLDSYSYYRGSLDEGAKLFCPNLPKLKRPDEIGQRRFTKRDKGFEEYAMRDAEVAYHIGKHIERMHRMYDIRQCVSIADMAATVFRSRYLERTIPQPSRDLIESSLLSYHGGKNNIAVKGGWYDNVRSLDISSAYPHAMAGLPSMSEEHLYKRLKRQVGNIRSVPELGVYQVSGEVDQCSYPVLFSHGFKPLSGKIDGVFIQGHEVNEALRAGELKLSSIRGWYYDAEKDTHPQPIRRYVDEFYAKKAAETDPIMRFWWKLLLNSLSGKFIQTRKKDRVGYTDVDADTTTTAAELEAGGLFHPFIASAITAHTRARIHRLEHDFRALHTATDGIFTQSTKRVPAMEGLGALETEYTGTLMLVRNKLYVLYAKEGKTESWGFAGQKIAKYALHGFQGRVHDLERLIATGQRDYVVHKPWTLKEAIRRGKVPNDFEDRAFKLRVGALPVRGQALPSDKRVSRQNKAKG